MKLKKLLVLASVSTTLFASIPHLEGFGLNIGPFDLRFGEDNGRDDRGYESSRREDIVDNPICRAISQQQKLEFLVEGKEKINAKEVKITTTRVTVEPYAFGFTKDRQPVLRGAVVDEKMVREITIKFGENQPETEAPENNQNQVSARAKESDDITVEVKNKGEEHNNKSFSGLFRSHKSKENVESLNLTKVGNIRIIENSHFDVPKNLKTLFKEDIDQIVCQVPSLRATNSQQQKGKIYSQDYAATDQDKKLNAIVRDQLSSTFSESYDKTIVIKTSNGVVTVTGTVEKFEDIQNIDDLIKGIAGVKKVDNRLTLKK